MTSLALGFGAGMALGTFHFGALWYTLRRIPETGNAGLRVVGSYVGRMAVLALGLFGVVRLGGAGALLAALLGILLARAWIVRRISPRTDSGADEATERDGQGGSDAAHAG